MLLLQIAIAIATAIVVGREKLLNNLHIRMKKRVLE
jgi:hypothetical protein